MKTIACLGCLLAAALLLFASCGDDPAVIDAAEALTICTDAFENAAKYGSDFSRLDVATLEKKEHWLIKLPGKMQNEYGAWRKVVAYCAVKKKNPDPANRYSPKALDRFELH
jgi:hypothetical protein